MSFISVDLGTTNIKVIAYDEAMTPLAEQSAGVQYLRSGDIVEFDAEAYFALLDELIHRCGEAAYGAAPYPVRQIVLTGQAESLVALGADGKPARNAISWLDMRSGAECGELRDAFTSDASFHTTGQPDMIPTWPVTKILWIKKHEPEVFARIAKYLLLKDYIQYRLCGELMGDCSIYNFSHYFDIVNKRYWGDMLNYVGIRRDQLPEPVPSLTVIGRVSAEAAAQTGLCTDAKVNVGTLDHFAGMIGTGNITPGIISESTGTVLALATLIDEPVFTESKVALHCGPFGGTYAFLPVCESGGISLEWFKNTFAKDVSFRDIDDGCAKKALPGRLTFLPYITGANAPLNDMDASGVFFGFRAGDDVYDFALAVMEGVAHMLNENIRYLAGAGVHADRIISTGGGAKSALWCQMKADISGYTVAVPGNREAACLGAAMIGAVSEGVFAGYAQAVASCVSIAKEYAPERFEQYEAKRRLFGSVYEGLKPSFAIQSGK